MFWTTTLQLKPILLLAGVGAISGSGLWLMLQAGAATAGRTWQGAWRTALVLAALAGGFYGCHLLTGQHLPIAARR